MTLERCWEEENEVRGSRDVVERDRGGKGQWILPEDVIELFIEGIIRLGKSLHACPRGRIKA